MTDGLDLTGGGARDGGTATVETEMPEPPETLQELFRRRQRELGMAGKPLTVREMWLRCNGKVSYETFRRIEEGTRSSRISDDTIDALALALDVPSSKVIEAIGRRPRLGTFVLPRRFERLTQSERALIVSIGDALLNARGDDGNGSVSELTPGGPARVTRAARMRRAKEK